jgi:hypothetical protein
MPEGFGKSRALFVSVDGVPSNIQTFVYDPPNIVNAAPDRIGVPLGYLRVFIDGTDGMLFGPDIQTDRKLTALVPDFVRVA